MEKLFRALGKGLGEEPEDSDLRIGPEALAKSLNFLSFGLITLQVEKETPAVSFSLNLEELDKTMDVKVFYGVLVWLSGLRTQHNVHEDAGSIFGLAQRLKDPTSL